MNRPVALLTGAIAVVGANSMVLAPITAAVARDLGGDPAEIVQAAAAYGLTTAISAMFLAPRSDTIGADRALNQAVIILIISLLASIFAPNKWALIGAQAFGGLGAGMAIPAIYVLAPQLGPKGEEKRTMGLVLSGWTLALVAGVAGSGFLAEWAGWRAVYVVLGVLMTGLWIALRSTDLKVPRVATSATSPLTALRVPGIWRGLFSALALMLSFYGTYAFVGAHVADALGRGTDVAGFITLCYGTGFGISTLLDKYFDRLAPLTAGAVSFAALAVIYALMAQLGMSLTLLAVLAVVWGMAQHLALNFVVSRLSALDQSQRGAILGLNSSVTYLAVFGGALAFRHPYELDGFAICNTISAVVATIAFVECVLPQRVTRRT
jgi:MFS transporter, DHA1 family, inner membrane transport protein